MQASRFAFYSNPRAWRGVRSAGKRCEPSRPLHVHVRGCRNRLSDASVRELAEHHLAAELRLLLDRRESITCAFLGSIPHVLARFWKSISQFDLPDCVAEPFCVF